MGGGDLNSKKSWHPNTMKNQERVWKAEQQAAVEKKRIQELQRERAEERDLAKLNDLARANSNISSNNDRLHWMYDKPDKKAHQEDYLLGKSIDKNYEEPDQNEDVIPAVARRVVGSSMLATTGDVQVDMARKIREDPLLLVKERERAARAALLNNPLQRRRLTELLRKEQAEREANKTKKKMKTKDNLDNMLAAKLSALSGDKNINLATLLASDDSSSSTDDSDSNRKRSKKKKKKNKLEKAKKAKKDKIKKKKSSRAKDTDSSHSSHGSVERDLKRRSFSLKNVDTKSKKHKDYKKNRTEKDNKKHRREKEKSDETPKRINVSGSSDSRKRRHDSESDESEREKKRSRDVAVEDRRSDRGGRKFVGRKREELSGQERAERLAAMAAEGVRHERERGRRVAEQRASERNEERSAGGARRSGASVQALPDSLEARIHSNRHYIQRDRRHMDQHFARR